MFKASLHASRFIKLYILFNVELRHREFSYRKNICCKGKEDPDSKKG